MTPPQSPDTKPGDPILVGDEFEIRVRVADTRRREHGTIEYWIVGGVLVPGDPQSGEVADWVCAETLRVGRRIARPLAVGDRVKFKLGQGYQDWRGDVLAIDDEEVWCKGDTTRVTLPLSALELSP